MGPERVQNARRMTAGSVSLPQYKCKSRTAPAAQGRRLWGIPNEAINHSSTPFVATCPNAGDAKVHWRSTGVMDSPLMSPAEAQHHPRNARCWIENRDDTEGDAHHTHDGLM